MTPNHDAHDDTMDTMGLFSSFIVTFVPIVFFVLKPSARAHHQLN
jgi:hypothetical protein